MSPVPVSYRLAVRALRGASPLLALGSAKLARGLRGRRTAHEVLARWGERERDPSRPTIWLHAPSVGEAMQADAVARALRQRRSGLQVAFTYFSPSAEAFAAGLGAAVSAFLPWDLPGPTARVLDALEPELLVFTKTEVWPGLVDAAFQRAIPVAIVAASVRPGAGRLRWPARRLLRPTWARLSLACAATDPDAEGLVRLGVPEGVVHTTGDPGIDSAARRVSEASASAPYLAPFLADPAPTVILGSTWPADENVALTALEEARVAVTGLRVLLAPHEPTPKRVRDVLSRLRALGWRATSLSDIEAAGTTGAPDAAQAVVVDRVGVLAHLYTVGHAAYVGGGFGQTGLHSVLEPAAAGVPVAFGPRHQSAPAASALLSAGGARTVTDAVSLARTLIEWLTVGESRRDAGARAGGYIDAHSGAAERTAELLDSLIAPSRA